MEGSASYTLEQMSGRPVQMMQSFMTSSVLVNDLLIKSDYYGSYYGLFAPQVNINKMMSLNLSQVNSLLGYQASVRSSETILFIVLLILGLGGLAVGVIALLKFMQAKKLADVTSGDRV